MRFLIVLLLYLFIFTCTYSQQRHGMEGMTIPVIRGEVVSEAKVPIPYVSVGLFSAKDSSVSKGTTTDEQGKFSIRTRPGNYFLKFSFLSYEELTIPGIRITDSVYNVGTVTMKTRVALLDEVVIQDEKSNMQLHLDKRVYNVGSDIRNIGSNAAELLDNVPSVAVDVDGNVSLRGSQNVRILVDGKPSGLTGISNADALRQLQSGLIESVEVITNPSARYDAEGEAGIINIILKKEKRTGLNGSYDLTVGRPDNYGGSVNMNYRRNKVNLFSGVGAHYRQNPGSGFSDQRFTFPDTSFSFIRHREHIRGGFSMNARAGADFNLGKENTLTISGLVKNTDGDNSAKITYLDYNEDGIQTLSTVRSEDESEKQNNLEGYLGYKKSFSQKGRQLSVDFKWMKSDDIEFSVLEESNDAIDTVIKQRNDNTENEENKLFQADYVHPFGKDGKIESGLKSTMRTIDNKYIVEELGADGQWFVLPRFDNHFVYEENIHAGYFSYGNKFKNFSALAGIRVEYSDVTSSLLKTNQINSRQYFDFFPNLHTSYKVNTVHTLQLSFSRRISRPGFRNLLPFFSAGDIRNFFSGNPDINPEYTYSFETGHLKQMEKGSVLSNIYYKYRTGVIERITTYDSTGNTLFFPINLSTQNSYGLEFNFSYELKKWWRANGNFNFYRSITEGEYAGESLHSDTYAWSSRMSTKFSIYRKLDVQVSGNYRAPQNTTQGYSKAMYSFDSGISMDVLKGNGTLSFTVRDIFDTRRRRSVTERPGFYSESEFQWHSRQLQLNFNYRLNQKKKKEGRQERMEENEMMDF